MKPTGDAVSLAAIGFDLSGDLSVKQAGGNGGGLPPRIAASHPFPWSCPTHSPVGLLRGVGNRQVEWRAGIGGGRGPGVFSWEN